LRSPFALAVVALASSPSRAAFERSPIGPEAAALGGVVAVSADPVFGNPAPVSALPGIEARAWAARPFAVAELAEAQASVAVRRGSVTAGLGARRFGSADYAEKELRLTGGWSPRAELGVGFAVRGLAVEGTGFPARRSIAADAGVRFRPAAGAEVAAVLEAVVGEVPGDPEGALRRTAVGASRRFGALAVRIEAQRREDRPLGGVLGVDWAPTRLLVLRAGAREDPASATWGFSVRLPGIEASVSVAHAELGRTVRVGIAAPGPR